MCFRAWFLAWDFCVPLNLAFDLKIKPFWFRLRQQQSLTFWSRILDTFLRPHAASPPAAQILFATHCNQSHQIKLYGIAQRLTSKRQVAFKTLLLDQICSHRFKKQATRLPKRVSLVIGSVGRAAQLWSINGARRVKVNRHGGGVEVMMWWGVEV